VIYVTPVIPAKNELLPSPCSLVTPLTASYGTVGEVAPCLPAYRREAIYFNGWEHQMRILLGVLLFIGLAACGSRSEETKDESTRVATDTLVETRQVADTLVVRTDSTIAADTAIKADTTIAADTTVTADTTIAADTTRVGDEGVIRVDTASVSDTTR
jgi:hypothetical protein